MILDKTASIARLLPNSENTDKEGYVEIDTLGAISINIQPANMELVAVTDGSFGQTYLGFTPASGIYIGDRVTISGTGDQFIVRGLNDWNFGSIPHFELVLFKGDN